MEGIFFNQFYILDDFYIFRKVAKIVQRFLVFVHPASPVVPSSVSVCLVATKEKL